MKGVSREFSLHPAHLTQDDQGNLPPSAFIPFCSYAGNDKTNGKQKPRTQSLSNCDWFEATVLEGQLCYALDVSKLDDDKTKLGKSKGLFLMLDPNPYQMISTVMESETRWSSKLYIHTLTPFTTIGPGSWMMRALSAGPGKTGISLRRSRPARAR